ncbi:M16 family metallopeptidase [Leeuwenhoekiella polynyae]|uniref:Putative Zn-dependent peptidase n=1 Tax=Leeuwenhoekiella polynyae TaxID=1550906 RepID=A0A4Q0PGG1_9FLAO|nr:insulinase family protein [Leeuwenhoekiella polynyae]RXG25626.1 putative Zn-dependent peptidase [Leeuwenhoekiella polynyae]
MQDIKRLKLLNFFSLICICFLMCSPFTYGQTQADTIETGVRRGTLDNGMRYIIHSKTAWEGQNVSMNLYVNTGHELEVEGQTDISHFMEHLPFAIFLDEATAAGGALLDAVHSGKYPWQGHTHARHTCYLFLFDTIGSEIYTAELDLLSRIIGGSLKPTPENLVAEHGSFYQEYIHRNGPLGYDEERLFWNLAKVYAPPVRPEYYYEHVKGFTWNEVSSFYKDWYHPKRATLMMVGPITDLDQAEQDIEAYFGKLKATPAKKLVYPQIAYLKSPNQFIQLEQLETDELELSETKIDLNWRNQIPPKAEPRALQHKWMYEMLYALIGDYLRQIPTTYRLHYKLGIDKEMRLPALRLNFTVFTGKEQEAVKQVIAALNQLKKQGVDEAAYQKYRQRELRAIDRRDTNALRSVLSTYDQQMLAEESLEFDQFALKKHWLTELTPAQVNTALNDFLKAGPQDIGIMAPKGASVLNLSETQFRSWLQEYERDSKQVDEVRETKLIADSLIAQLTQKDSKDLGSDALGGSVLQLANGTRVVLYPQEGAPLKLHGFRNVGASNLNKEDFIKAQLVPEWVHISGAGAYTHFELQQMLTDLGMIYGRALYVNQGESGIKLQAPPQRLEALLQLAHLFLSAPREDPEAFTYWQEDEYLFYKRPPYGREENDLQVLSKKELEGPNAGLTALARYEAVQQSTMSELKHIYQSLFQHPQEFLFLLSGDFKEAEVLPLLEIYLGNLPVSENQVKREEKKVNTLPIGLLEKVYTIPGILPSDLNLKIQYTYPIVRDDWKAQLNLQLMRDVINTRLWELRHVKKRGLYLIQAVAYTDLDLQRGNFAIMLPTVAGMENYLIKDMQELVSRFKEHPISVKELDAIKSRFYKMGITGKSILDKGYRYYKWDLQLPNVETVKAYLEGISPRDIQALIQEKLVPEHQYIFMGKGGDISN